MYYFTLLDQILLLFKNLPQSQKGYTWLGSAQVTIIQNCNSNQILG